MHIIYRILYFMWDGMKKIGEMQYSVAEMECALVNRKTHVAKLTQFTCLDAKTADEISRWVDKKNHSQP